MSAMSAMSIAPYWRPDPLPLPRTTRTLFWHEDPADAGVLWFVDNLRKRVRGDIAACTPHAIPQDLLELALIHESRGFEPPAWAVRKQRRRRSALTRPLHYQTHYQHLPRHHFVTEATSGPTSRGIDSGPGGRAEILIVHMAHLTSGPYSWGTRSRSVQHFLVFTRRPEDAPIADDPSGASRQPVWALYPRTLRRRGYEGGPGVILRQKSLERLAPLWRDAILAQPEIALTSSARRAGQPALLGLLLDPSRNSYKDCAIDGPSPFWRAANHALIALTAARGICLPGPDTRSVLPQRFTWSVFAHPLEEVETGYFSHQIVLRSPPKLQVTLVENGWDHLGLRKESDSSPPSPATKQVLAEISVILCDLLLQMAPSDDPFFWDARETDLSSLSHYSNCGTLAFLPSLFCPGWGPEHHPVGSSRHAVLHHLSQLPPEWRATLRPRLWPTRDAA